MVVNRRSPIRSRGRTPAGTTEISAASRSRLARPVWSRTSEFGRQRFKRPGQATPLLSHLVQRIGREPRPGPYFRPVTHDQTHGTGRPQRQRGDWRSPLRQTMTRPKLARRGADFGATRDQTRRRGCQFALNHSSRLRLRARCKARSGCRFLASAKPQAAFGLLQAALCVPIKVVPSFTG